jgi:hypothetical protein
MPKGQREAHSRAFKGPFHLFGIIIFTGGKMKKVKQYKIAERAAYGFKKTDAEEGKLERKKIQWRKKGIHVSMYDRYECIEDPKRLLEVLTNEVKANGIFYKKGSDYEHALTPKLKEFLTKHYIPYVHREYLELINALLKKQAEKPYKEYVREK